MERTYWSANRVMIERRTLPDSITVKKQNRVTQIATENNLPIVALVQSVS